MPTARSLITSGEKRLLEGPHPERARLDSETLLLGALEKSRAWLFAHLDDEIDRDDAVRYVTLILFRLKGEPVQYIAGQTEFYGLPFRLNRSVLIPRPETEHLVEKVLSLATRFDSPRIVDVGTGSGCIAVTLAHHLPKARITAIDISSAALASASESAYLNGILQRVRLLEGDLLAPVAAENFEIVVSNPPYIPTVDRDSLSVEVRDFEPALALFGGEDGLEIYRRLIPVAHTQLVTGGYLALEIGYGQQEAIRALLLEAGFTAIEFLPDLQQILRVAAARKP